MRIIAGERRGHKIDGPLGRALRPTSDMVREAIFNILRDSIDGQPVLDLFAGTGALGLEALSRGASHAIFVERDRGHVAIIRRNLAALRFESRGSIVQTDAYRWARTFQPVEGQPVLVFVDPPYFDYEDRPKRLRGLLDELVAKLPDRSILVVESGRPLGEDLLEEPGRWDHRRYGGTCLSILTVGGDAPEPTEVADEPAAEPE
jgi:16S rRNA (guanine966-N2)-methyltransferase